MFKLSISNIAWKSNLDSQVYALMRKIGYSGLEIAPTRIFAYEPYEQIDKARIWAENLKEEYNFTISSMQSIWYGKTEKLFGTEIERQNLINYTKKAINFAQAVGCKNIVFGCSKNRIISKEADSDIAIPFFREIGNYAFKHGTIIGMEANPEIYNTNYINSTREAINLIEEVQSEGFKLNLDVGAMLQNNEDTSLLEEKVDLINHIHISEPFLDVIKSHKLHEELASLLCKSNYSRYISIEMKNGEELNTIESVMSYVKTIFQ